MDLEYPLQDANAIKASFNFQYQSEFCLSHALWIDLCFEKILYMFSWGLSNDINILSWIFIVSVV